MKKRFLPGGQPIQFPDNTPESVITETLNRITGAKSNLSLNDEQLIKVIESVSTAFSNFENAKTDNYKQLIEDQKDQVEKMIGELSELVKDSVSSLSKSQGENFKNMLSTLKVDNIVKSLDDLNKTMSSVKFDANTKELAKQIVNVSNQLTVMSSKLDNRQLLATIDENTKAINDLVKAQNAQTAAFLEFIKVLKAPKVITRDGDKITGIKTG